MVVQTERLKKQNRYPDRINIDSYFHKIIITENRELRTEN